VRSDDQIKALSKLGVNVIQLDLSNEAAVINAVLDNSIDIVIHAASSIVGTLASNLIKALGERRKDGGVDVSFIHVSFIVATSRWQV
jgi:saccharopine dehydrogenase-like NADP-dependent oxidoreductase